MGSVWRAIGMRAVQVCGHGYSDVKKMLLPRGAQDGERHPVCCRRPAQHDSTGVKAPRRRGPRPKPSCYREAAQSHDAISVSPTVVGSPQLSPLRLAGLPHLFTLESAWSPPGTALSPLPPPAGAPPNSASGFSDFVCRTLRSLCVLRAVYNGLYIVRYY